MGSDSNQVPGLSLPQPSGEGGGASVVAGGGALGAQATTPVPAPTVPVGAAATEDELDQEWVNKARDIVEQTKADPFALSNELNKVKAEYLKVRFNKELNVGEHSSQ